MSRFKTFDSTGVAPNGVVYAGDLNSIQDRYADLSNYSQTVDVGTLRVGESALQLLRYSSSPLEARITAALRTDGILRGLSGLVAGAYTTAQRDAIAAGQRPFTMIIFNTTTNQLEINMGSDATPSWQPVGFSSLPVGSLIPYTGAEGDIPVGWGLADGATLVRADYAVLNSLYSAQSYPFGNGNGTTTFNKPDMRGRDAVGRDNMGGTAASRVPGVNTMGANGGTYQETLDITKIPSHSHTGTTGSSGAHTHTTDNPGNHTHGVTDPSHGHSVNDPTHAHAIGAFATTGTMGYPSMGLAASNPYYAGSVWVSVGGYSGITNNSGTGISINGAYTGISIQGGGGHTHTALSAGAHTHTITAEGGGNPHNNMQPYLAVNWIVKLQ